MMKKYLLIFVLFICVNFSALASHFMGGEITWECNTDPLSADYGKYTFFLKIYQDCDGIDFSQVSENLTVHNNPGLTSITLNFLTTNDISPSGVSGSSTCYDCNTQPNGQFGAVKEWIYSSGAIVLNGTPNTSGWHFTWGSCCRSSNITNGMSDDDWTLRAVMYPYTDLAGNVFPSGNICYDNSPIFKEQAKSILCTGYPFSYSHLAFDVELDSLSYSWAEPLGANTSYNFNNPLAIALPFSAPYSATAPIPGNPTLNNENGEISFNSNTAGVFVTCVKVAAFKCGQIVAEVFREVQVVLKNCGTLPNGMPNLPPTITAPVGSQNWITTLNASTGLPSYEATIMAGELVSFSVSATDNDINITGNLQDLALEVEGGQLDPNLALSNPATFTVTSSSPGNITGDFLWQSNCDHMQDYGCGRAGGAFTFNLKSYDDFCPANGIVIATISINIIPPQPDLRCLSVAIDGGVDLFYSFPQGVVDTAIKYDIYHSKQLAGPYALIDSTFYPDTTYYHQNSTADVSKSFYFLLGTVTCGSNIGGGSDSLLYSDTLSTILMNATAINLGVTADLDWNPIHNPLLPSSSSDYDLHYINVSNVDNIIITSPNLVYQKDGDNCDYYPEFYVEISDISGCVSKSSIGTVHLLDTITPVTPIIKDISINALDRSVITWLPSTGSDFYIIYMEDNNGAWITLDTVLSVLNSYEFASSLASQNIEKFSVRAVDSCGNARIRSLAHNSMLLVNSSDVCDYSISLDWNEYINWANGVSHYNVFVTETDSNNIATNSVIRRTSTELLLNNINSTSIYTAYVESYNDDSTFIAVSNVLNLSIASPNRPMFNYLEYATVNHDNGLVEINCLVDNNAVIDHYDIYRTSEFNINGVGINFSKIDEVNFTGNTNFIFNDNNTNTNTTSYRYKVYPVDTCGVSQSPPPVDNPIYSGEVSFAQTILLGVEKNIDYSDDPALSSEFTNTVFFNEYEKWLGSVLKYELYRSVNNEPYNLLPIYTWDREINPAEELLFIDKVTNEGKGNGRFCYYIKASEGNVTPYGAVPEGSSSNIVCISQTPVVYMPNTFTPNNDDHNELFMPVTYFVSEVGYSFSIYNQQGSEMFATNTPAKGWDGTFRGEQVQNDNYVYYLKYINGDGELIEKTGAVTLVR
jgi:gliding motility-associated-like protein